jgi:hypothetical protein
VDLVSKARRESDERCLALNSEIKSMNEAHTANHVDMQTHISGLEVTIFTKRVLLDSYVIMPLG